MVKCLFAWPGLVMSTLESLLVYYPLAGGTYRKHRNSRIILIYFVAVRFL